MSRKPRPFIGMLFKCCHVYVRLYLNPSGTAYAGACPKCRQRVELKTVPNGSPSKFWSCNN